jgi:DNA-binding NarL/FixJ family response regulator
MFVTPVKILIVEDEPLIAEGIALHLKNSNFTVSAIAYDADEALQVLQTKTLDIAILDINLDSEKDGIELAEYINKSYPMPFIYLTSYSDKAIMDRAKATSPAGFIVKPFNKNTLLATLEIAMSNFVQQSNNHVPQLSLVKINKNLTDPISDREFEILQLLYDGKTNQEICDLLFIAMNTVKRHVTNSYFKLDVKSRTEAITLIRNYMLK